MTNPADKTSRAKFIIQDEQYTFPYHFIPYIDANGIGRWSRRLMWGLEYLCYTGHVVERILDLEPASILDVGCGEGRLLGMLGAAVPRRIGVDLSDRAIHFARAFHPEVEFHIMDAAAIDETFDVVTAIQVLEHIPDEDLAGFFQTLARRIKPNGYALICVPSDVVPLNKKHYRHYNVELFQQQLESSEAPLTVTKVEHLCQETLGNRLFRKASISIPWLFEIPLIQQWVWNYHWRKLRTAKPQNGRHILFITQRV
jgi:2-polyprenyl-3-methyl-5-hydroxy-6-metoxy-1,4-benzoquinol methylase